MLGVLIILVAPGHAAERRTSRQLDVAPASRAESRRPVVDPALTDSALDDAQLDEATLRQLLEDVKTNTELLSAHAKEIGELQGWRNELRESLETQRKILEAITRTDAQGQTVLRMDQNSDEFRQEMRSAVQNTYQQTGRVTVRNSTSRTQEIWINNQREFLLPAETREYEVPTGTATVEVPDGDRTTWSIGPPNYKAEMTLVPDDRRTTTYRPLSPLPPTYYYYPASTP